MNRVSVLAASLVLTSGVAPAQTTRDVETGVVEALEAVAGSISKNPTDCGAVRDAATKFQEQHGQGLAGLKGAGGSAALAQRLDAARERLRPALEACTKPVSPPIEALPRDCQNVKKRCQRNCPLDGWMCTSHWLGCLSGYRPSCCWAAACGSKKNCMRVCEESCVCDVETAGPE